MRNKLRWPVAASLLLCAFTSAGSRQAERGPLQYEPTPAALPYVRTVVVSPTPGNAVASGNTLVQAMQGITNATSANPYLVQIEPGVYDLGLNILQMKPYVDVEGSGQGVTTIIGRNSIAVATANFTELRSLTIKNLGAQSNAAGVSVGATSPRLTNVTVLLSGANTCTSACNGVTIEGTAAPTLTDVTIRVTTKGTQNRGISCSGARGRLNLTKVLIEVTGATTYNDGIVFTGGTLNDPPLTLTAADSTINVSGPTQPGTSPVGISSYKDILRLTGVTVNAGYIGVVLAGYGASELTIDRSTIQGRTRASVYYGGQKGFARIGASKLISPVEGFARCVASYNGQYLPLDAACK